MVKKFSYKKATEGDYASCWFCNSKTYFTLTDTTTKEEIWCCSLCALKYAKIKRLSKIMSLHSQNKKSLKISENSPIKKREIDAGECYQ